MDPEAINIGWSLFDETQFRIETDRDGAFSDQQLRFSIKPIFGMVNENALVDHQLVLKKLYKTEEQNQNLLFLYRKILQTWKILQIEKAFSKSSHLFERAKKQLRKYSSSNRDLTTSLVSDLTFYVENKAKVDFYHNQVNVQVFKNYQGIAEEIGRLKFVSDQGLSGFLQKAPKSPNSDIEKEERQLQEMQFDQKKMENRQLLKFVSMSRQKGINRFEDYRIQLAFRVPFLSDSLEFEEAKTDFLREGQKIKSAELKKQSTYEELMARMRGALQKNEILKWAPKKSYGQMKVSEQLGTLSETVKSEVQLLKLQVSAIENRVEIMDLYLQILAMNNQLTSVQSNYLTQIPTIQ